MNGAHLHLLLNHIPVIGMMFGLILTAIGLLTKNRTLQKTALWTVFIIALLTIPAYLTGGPAEDIVETYPGIAEADIEQHEDAALTAFLAALVVGIVALAGLVTSRGKKRVGGLWSGLSLVGLLVVVGLMTWTANLGGRIRHPEIVVGAAVIENDDETGQVGLPAADDDDDDSLGHDSATDDD